jgi:hypothetical protein
MTPEPATLNRSIAKWGFAHTDPGVLSEAEVTAAGLLVRSRIGYRHFLAEHQRRPGCMEGVTVKTGDVVILIDRHAHRIGTVIAVFTSVTGEEVYDVQLAGTHRIAALAGDIVANLGPHVTEETSLRIGKWLRSE